MISWKRDQFWTPSFERNPDGGVPSRRNPVLTRPAPGQTSPGVAGQDHQDQTAPEMTSTQVVRWAIFPGQVGGPLPPATLPGDRKGKGQPGSPPPAFLAAARFQERPPGCLPQSKVPDPACRNSWFREIVHGCSYVSSSIRASKAEVSSRYRLLFTLTVLPTGGQ